MTEFEKIYPIIAEIAKKNSRGRINYFEDVKLAQQDASGVKKSDLLDIANDKEFVKHCYFKIMGRNPHRRELVKYSGMLTAGKVEREQLIENLQKSDEYINKSVKVRLI